MTSFYFGKDGLPKIATQIYMGIEGVPKKITKIYYGINGQPKEIFSSKEKIGIINANICNIINSSVKSEYDTSIYNHIISVSGSEYLVNSDKSSGTTAGRNIATNANKIKLIDNSTHNSIGFFYCNGDTTPLNLNYFICNEITNLNFFVSNRYISDGLNKLNIDNGNNFKNAFYATKVIGSQKLTINVQPGACMNYTFTNINAPELSIFINSNFSKASVHLLRAFANMYKLNSVTLIGNYMDEPYFGQSSSAAKVNYINLNINVNNMTHLCFNLNDAYFFGKINCRTTNLNQAFDNFKGGGYIYLNFPDSGYNVTNFMLNRNSPIDNFYIWVQFNVKIDRIKTNIKPGNSSSTAYTFSTAVYGAMPDNPLKKYNGYYNEAAKVYLLYET